MSEISRDMNTSADIKIEPDLFQFYIRGVSELLLRNDFSPSSLASPQLVGAGNRSFKDKKENNSSHEKNAPVGFGSLFRDVIGDRISDYEKARLMTVLRQSVVALTHEVDEMLDPAFAMQRLRQLLAPTNTCARFQDANCKVETENHRPNKRLKVESSLSLVNEPLTANCNLNGVNGVAKTKPGEWLAKCCNKECAKFVKVDNNTHKSNPDESKSLCDNCMKQENKVPKYKDKNESFLGSCSRDDKGNGEVNDDLQVLLVNRGPKVVEKMEKHAAELSSTLGRMEEKLEVLLDTVISSCRAMTLAEKYDLRRLIQKLPPKNLHRVAQIIQRGKPSEKQSTNDDDDNITVELQHEDNLTLWRIYFYVKAVENAQKLLV